MTPDESTLLYLMGYVFLQNARPDKAVVVLEALDVMQPRQPQTLRALAVSQLRSGQPARALQTLDKLAMSGGVDAVFYLLRAQALQACGRLEEARVAMKTHLHMRKPAPAGA